MNARKKKTQKSKTVSQKFQSILISNKGLSIYLGVFALIIALVAVVGTFATLLSNNQDTAQAGVVCPAGYTWSGSQCTQGGTVPKVCTQGGTLQTDGSCLVPGQTFTPGSIILADFTASGTFIGAGSMYETNRNAACPSGYSLVGGDGVVDYRNDGGSGLNLTHYGTSVCAQNGLNSAILLADFTASGTFIGAGSGYETNRNAACPSGFTLVGGDGVVDYSNDGGSGFNLTHYGTSVCGPSGAIILADFTASGTFIGAGSMYETNRNAACPSGYSLVGGDGVVDYRNDGGSGLNLTHYGTSVCAQNSFSLPGTQTSYTSTCPSGYTAASATTCASSQTASPTGYQIDNPSVGQGTCTPDTITIGSTTNCTFPLTGAPNGVPYTIPSQGLYAGITNTNGNTSSYLGNSNACTVAGAVLTCNSVPSTGGTVGTKDVIIHQPNVAFYDSKEQVTLTQGTPSTTITLTNIGTSTDCTSTKTVAIPQTYVCNFPLTGASNNNYALPSEGITAATSQNGGTDVTPLSSGYSPACTITGNSTAQAVLTCSAIPTQSGTAGGKNVIVRIGTTSPSDKGDVTLTTTIADSDGDGIPDTVECNNTMTNCPDTDGDGTPDYQDLDTDGDGIPDSIERGPTCATLANCTPVDTDGDGTPNYRDLDSDGDTIPDSVEKGSSCATLANCVPVDTDKDGTPDYLDLDSDGDGIPDRVEATCSVKTSMLSINASAQQSQVGLNYNPCNTDGDTQQDYVDLDSDNDGLTDSNEKGSTCASLTNCVPVDTDKNGVPDFRQANTNTTLVRTGGISAAVLITALGIVAIGSYIVFTNSKSNKLKIAK